MWGSWQSADASRSTSKRGGVSRHSMFDVRCRCSMFDARCSVPDVRGAGFGMRLLGSGVRYLKFGIRASVLGVWELGWGWVAISVDPRVEADTGVPSVRDGTTPPCAALVSGKPFGSRTSLRSVRPGGRNRRCSALKVCVRHAYKNPESGGWAAGAAGAAHKGLKVSPPGTHANGAVAAARARVVPPPFACGNQWLRARTLSRGGSDLESAVISNQRLSVRTSQPVSD